MCHIVNFTNLHRRIKLRSTIPCRLIHGSHISPKRVTFSLIWYWPKMDHQAGCTTLQWLHGLCHKSLPQVDILSEEKSFLQGGSPIVLKLKLVNTKGYARVLWLLWHSEWDVTGANVFQLAVNKTCLNSKLHNCTNFSNNTFILCHGRCRPEFKIDLFLVKEWT